MKKSVLKSIIIAILAFVMLASFTGCDYLEGILPESLSGIISGNQSDKTPDNQDQEQNQDQDQDQDQEQDQEQDQDQDQDQEQESVSPTPDDSTHIPVSGSVGLEYTLRSDGTSYSVSGIGTCTDTDLNIPSMYEGLPVTNIGYRAFKECTSLTSVTIPDSVTTIGDDAFYYCASLTSVTIPNSVTSIGESAFSDCYSLTSITIPDSVTSIGMHAFYECTSLEEIYFNATAMSDIICDYYNYVFYDAGKNGNGIKVVIGANVTKIPAYLFCPQTNISSYSPKIVNVEFEEGSVCESIGRGAFYFCYNLTSITIPDSVTSIGSYAFYHSGLTSITIPDGVTSIADQTFLGCGLTSIVIPDSVTSIGDYAFSYCTSLTSVTIPDNITSIGGSAFEGCTSLYVVYNNSDLFFEIGSSSNGFAAYYAKILVDNGVTSYGNDKYDYINIDDEFLFSYDGSQHQYSLVAYIGGEDTVTLPRDIEGNAYEIYKLRGVTNVIIPDNINITSIGEYAFYECGSLRSVTIGNSVTSIESRAFSYCYRLRSVTIGDSVTSIGSYAFSECNNLRSVTIGDGVTSIGYSAFYSCDSLTSVTMGNSVTSIESDAFSGCTSLTSVTIPDSITSISDSAFSWCTSIQYNEYGDAYYLGNEANPYVVFVRPKSDSITSTVIHDNTRFIFNSAFSKCYRLTSITIPDSVTVIGKNAFYDCVRLEEIYFNATAMSDLSSQNYAFYNAGKNSNGIKVVIGANVTKIPAYLFYPTSDNSYSPKIVSVEFEEGSVCESIGDYVFRGCTGLTSITIPDSVTSIGYYAFCGCNSLTSVTIPDSVTKIGSSAFSGCSGLTSVTIPDSVTSIGAGAFSGCTSLQYSEYGNAYYLGNEANPYVACVLSKNKSITTATIHDNTRIIANSAFSNCLSLTSITIPDSVTSIGIYAFNRCTNLASVTIPDSVTSIGESAFYDCYSLTSINFEGTVEQWNAISLGGDWDYKVPATEVICSDGTVQLK